LWQLRFFESIQRQVNKMFVRKFENSGSIKANYNAGPREMHDVTCSECGKQTQVPFKPDGSRPVYCSNCYQKHRPARAPRRY
jgi:CxxC-x17-CxxC domain-containing protein